MHCWLLYFGVLNNSIHCYCVPITRKADSLKTHDLRSQMQHYPISLLFLCLPQSLPLCYPLHTHMMPQQLCEPISNFTQSSWPMGHIHISKWANLTVSFIFCQLPPSIPSHLKSQFLNKCTGSYPLKDFSSFGLFLPLLDHKSLPFIEGSDFKDCSLQFIQTNSSVSIFLYFFFCLRVAYKYLVHLFIFTYSLFTAIWVSSPPLHRNCSCLSQQ